MFDLLVCLQYFVNTVLHLGKSIFLTHFYPDKSGLYPCIVHEGSLNRLIMDICVSQCFLPPSSKHQLREYLFGRMKSVMQVQLQRLVDLLKNTEVTLTARCDSTPSSTM